MMKKIGLVLLLNLALGLAIVWGQGDEKPHWTYAGEAGPDHWGELDPSYALCNVGRAQSPIDLHDSIAVNLTDITFNYQPSALNLFNNGHTIQVNYDAGSSITYNETPYRLLQFHFHHPSEHTLNGEAMAMELHLVHQDDAGNLAVVGVMLTVGEADNAAYAAIFDHLPTEEGEPDSMGMAIDVNDLLPQHKAFFTYLGSLTTPPCAQGVRWLVLTDPIELSAVQIEAFAAIFELNARPVQPLNERDLLQDNS